ncbi:MAG: hypothetical protein M1828_004843 [Chrysothrix sp. TS-e1954]|nr:MAG: hypothetical protein M1828_004843 [Chrysothrix sp. TS-e1954]
MSNRDRPTIIPGCTSHTRLFPKFHSFTYPYLLVGIPVVPGGFQGSMLSVDVLSWWRRGWLSVEARDHLGRGNNVKGLHGKVVDHLKLEGVDPSRFPHIYLITAPRFLRHIFAPASFWFLYSEEYELKAMIAEVNNTFDERRMYYLPYSMFGTSAEEAASEVSENEKRLPQKFSHTFAKDFHVSPFSSRKGGYTLTAQDPLASMAPEGVVVANIVATLRSSKGHGKLVARLLSTSKSLDPAMMSYIHRITFLLSWSVTGWITFPRIVLEAVKLAQRRGLSIWYRPEVNPTTVSRNSTPEEDVLETLFRKYLQAKVKNFPDPISLRYVAAEQLDPTFSRKATFTSEGNGQQRTQRPQTMELRIVTPAFYSRFVYYHNDESAFTSELLDTRLENRTARISDEELCQPLASSGPCTAIAKHADDTMDTSTALGWSLLRRLRRIPDRGLYPYPALPSLRSSQPKHPEEEHMIHSNSFSSFDRFIKASCSEQEQKEYRRVATRIFLSVKRTLGFDLHPDVLASSNAPRIADVATGNALWLLDAASSLPGNATLDGFDISLSQCPPKEWLPKNVHLHEWDIHKEPPAEFQGMYDIVHVRFIGLVITDNHGGNEIANIKKLLKPGGWLQWEEYDNSADYVEKARPDIDTPALDLMLRFGNNPQADRDMPRTGTFKWKDELLPTIKSKGFEQATQRTYTDYCKDNLALAKFYGDQYILVCEEFANKVFPKDAATMWIHEMISAATTETAKGAAIVIPLALFMARNPM